jgi:hypothetical protein
MAHIHVYIYICYITIYIHIYYAYMHICICCKHQVCLKYVIVHQAEISDPFGAAFEALKRKKGAEIPPIWMIFPAKVASVLGFLGPPVTPVAP